MSETTLADRVQGMIWGQFVGDAAALGAHWIYELDELASAYPELHGFERPQPGHYHEGKSPGDQTHYGDAALLLLESVAEQGRFDVADFAERFTAFFGDEKIRSYRDGATKGTLEHLAADPHNFRNGADDNQPATITRMAPVVAVHGADPSVIEELTRFCQNNDQAVGYCQANARILAALLEGAALPLAFGQASYEQATADITQAEAARDLEVTEATARLGQSCPLPKSFPAAVQTALRHPDDFRQAIVAAIAAGGDSAARCSMIGAWLGAAGGLDAVPADWREKLSAKDRIHAALQRLSTLRSTPVP